MGAWLVVAVGVWLGACSPSEPTPSETRVQMVNRGRAHLENRESRQALEAFGRVVDLDSSSASAWRNLARAHLLARDHEGAAVALAKAEALRNDSAATAYLQGLVHLRTNRFEEAVERLEAAVRWDVSTAAIRFQLARALRSSGRHEEAAEQLRETIRLEPLHPTAHYWLSIYARQAGDAAEHAVRQRDFARARELLGDDQRTPEALEACQHTRAEAGAPKRRPPPSDLRWRLADGIWPSGLRALTVLEVDAAGRPTLLAVDREGELHRVAPSRDSTGVVAPLGLRLPSGRLDGVAVAGNYQDPWELGRPFDPRSDARMDVLWVHGEGLRLWRGLEAGGFEDVTDSSGLSQASGAESAIWVDYEADGDLDIALAAGRGVELWQNNGDGTFVEISGLVGLHPERPLAPALDLAATDLDGDVVLDLVVASLEGTAVFENQRTGLFQERADAVPGRWPAAELVLLEDLDQDGAADAVLWAAGRVLVIPARGDRVELEPRGLHAEALALADLDNDGWVDLIAAGRVDRGSTAAGTAGGIRGWRNLGEAGWGELHWQGKGASGPSDAPGHPSALELPPVQHMLAVDLDADGDTDLLLGSEGGTHVLENLGDPRYRQLKIRLVGTKTNTAGIGTRVEVRHGKFRASRRVHALPIEIGLGRGWEELDRDSHERDAAELSSLDAVRVLWTNGIVDNQIGVEADSRSTMLEIVEKNVAAGSCPFLYAWNGREHRFVTDILGNSPVGLSISRGVPLDADPDELVEIGPAAGFPPLEGFYSVLVTEEMREALYLDAVELVAVDHPPEVEVHSRDKLAPAPFPESELWAIAEVRAPVRALGSDGLDRTAEVAESDGRFAAAGVPLPPPLRGQTQPLALDLDFGWQRRAPDPAAAWVLVLEGWLQYGDASTNIALSQGAASVMSPKLEVETRSGFRP
ncbi:MAG: FG-GAP-like repeat-containing protein, partial [Holophagales bacterium]|nr:FG-GAP-like repeat-containing protein [Holophagales bacterium]